MNTKKIAKHTKGKKSQCEKVALPLEELRKIENKSTDLFSDIPKSARSSLSNNIMNAFKFNERSRMPALDKSRSVAEDSLLIKTPATAQLMVSALDLTVLEKSVPIPQESQQQSSNGVKPVEMQILPLEEL